MQGRRELEKEDKESEHEEHGRHRNDRIGWKEKLEGKLNENKCNREKGGKIKRWEKKDIRKEREGERK